MGVLQGLAECNGRLYAMWKGEPGDDRIFYSSWSGSGAWLPQVALAGNTSHGPALANFAGTLVAAWKGEWSDPRLFFTKLNGSTWEPQAQIKGVYSDVGPSLAQVGSKLVMAWKNAFDQYLYYATYNGSTWSGPSPIPGTASSVGPSLCAVGTTLYAAWKGEYTDQGIYYASYNGTSWTAQKQIPNVGTSVGPALAAVGSKLYAVWKGEGTDQGLYYSTFDGSSWTAQTKIANAGSSVGVALANFNGKVYGVGCGANGNVSLFSMDFNGTSWSAPANVIPGNTGQDNLGPVVAAPGGGLGSSSNYILYDNGQNLKDVQVSIWITEDLESSNGFSFQLNSYCPNPQGDSCAWQQYCIAVVSNSLNLTINNWPVDWDVNGNYVDLILEWVELQSLPSNKLPAGYVITLTLQNDATGNITGCNVVVVDNNGKVQANVTKTLLGFNFPGFTAADQKPINGFELDLVGPDGGAATTLTSGQGVLVLSASNSLTCRNTEPPGALGIGTAETSNSHYSSMPVAYGNGEFCQLFSINPAVTQEEMIAQRKGLHALRRPGLNLKAGEFFVDADVVHVPAGV